MNPSPDVSISMKAARYVEGRRSAWKEEDKERVV